MPQHRKIDDTTTYQLPPLGDNPSTTRAGTTPGAFANRNRVGTPWTFSSPDAPGMPAPSDKTAWDFMPADWVCLVPPLPAGGAGASEAERAAAIAAHAAARQSATGWRAPEGFVPSTQLEHARLGRITPQMQ